MNSNSNPSDLGEIILQIVNKRKPQTVKQLIAFVKEELSISEKEIANAILNLQAQDNIKLENQPLSASPELTTYMKTEQALWYWATIATATITAVVVFMVPENLYPLSYLRIGLGATLILWLPGYSLVRALFPQQLKRARTNKTTMTLDTVDRIALSLAISLALVPVIGLALNYTPWGIRLTPIVLSLVALTFIFATVALVRENRQLATIASEERENFIAKTIYQYQQCPNIARAQRENVDKKLCRTNRNEIR